MQLNREQWDALMRAAAAQELHAEAAGASHEARLLRQVQVKMRSLLATHDRIESQEAASKK